MGPAHASSEGYPGRLATAAVCLALLGLAYGLWTDRSPPPEPAQRATTDRQTPLQPGPIEAPQRQRSQAIPHQPKTSPANLSLPHVFRLRIRVVDAFGLPVPGANLYAATAQSGFGMLPELTNRRGVAEFTCRGRRPEMTLWLATLADGEIQVMQTASILSGQTTSVTALIEGPVRESTELQKLLASDSPDVILTKLGSRKQREADQSDIEQDRTQRRGQIQLRDAHDILCGRHVMLFDELACVACHDASEVAAYVPFDLARDLLPKLHPAAVFADLHRTRVNSNERKSRRLRLRQQLTTEPSHVASDSSAPELGMVEGQVIDANGDTPGIVPVAWLDRDGFLRGRCATDANGRYRISLPAGKTCRLVAGGGSAGLATAHVIPAQGAEVRQDFTLKRAMEIRGVVTDEQDLPLVDWRITFFSIPELLACSATSSNDGSFTLSPKGMIGKCLLWPNRQSLKLPVLATGAVSSTGQPLRLQLPTDPPTRGHLRLRPGLPLGHADVPVEMRLLQMDTGFATHLTPTGVDEAFELEGLPAGFYRGELGAPGLGWVSFGPLYLNGRGLWDCGTIDLPPPGRLVVTAQAATWPLPNDQFACYRQTAETDIHVPATFAEDGSISLPAGQYALLWLEGTQLYSTTFSVRSAETTTLTLSRSD